MDMSLVTAALGMQASNTQTQIATTVLKQNLDAQRQVVDALLGTGSQGGNSLANVGAGIGGNLNISA
ncbi:putative motility protein [Rhodopseudomonas sp. B29]|uniref:putative motility protein n=1 Tax=Rhodopseudomonas sp. B29 TaxID=95607 RepID=UPI00034B63BE|nr:YjfB family protein [Rhodopseudomonas sp. B29]